MNAAQLVLEALPLLLDLLRRLFSGTAAMPPDEFDAAVAQWLAASRARVSADEAEETAAAFVGPRKPAP